MAIDDQLVQLNMKIPNLVRRAIRALANEADMGVQEFVISVLRQHTELDKRTFLFAQSVASEHHNINSGHEEYTTSAAVNHPADENVTMPAEATPEAAY